MTGMPGMNFVMTISTLDCTGCGSCVQVCPGMKGNKALAMSPIDNERPGQAAVSYTHLITWLPVLPLTA